MSEIRTPLQHAHMDRTCFGCGPANPDGLHIHSYWSDDGLTVISEFHPQPKYNAGLPNVMYGGLIASLIDCHSIWTAMAFTYRAENRDPASEPRIVTVTGELSVKYLAPTPLDQPIFLRAWVDGEVARKTTVLCELGYADTVTATGRVIAVRLQPPASQPLM